MYHERLHQVDKNKTTFSSHAEIYLQQILHSSFGSVDRDIQIATIATFSQMNMNALYQNERGVLSRIDQFNQSNNMGYKLIFDVQKKSTYLYQNNIGINTTNYAPRKNPN